MGDHGLDWLVAVHPGSIHWLTGSDAKSYQEFQCLLVGARREPLVVLTREGERHEFETDSLADEVQGWGGGIVEDPVAAFAALAKRHGLLEPHRQVLTAEADHLDRRRAQDALRQDHAPPAARHR